MFSKKAQVSLEILIILSIIVIGAIGVGVYELNTLNKHMQKEPNTDFDSSRVFGKNNSSCLASQLLLAATPIPGDYSSYQYIKLINIESCEAPYTIYYTTDSTEPTMSSQIYSQPIGINQTTTIKAKAFLDSNSSIYSDILEVTYTISN